MDDTTLSAGELQAWLTLLRAPGLGAAACKALLARCGPSAAAVLTAGPIGWREAGVGPAAAAWLRQPDPNLLALDLRWLDQATHHLLPLTHADYPPLLAACADAPAALFVAGDPTALWLPQLAIVGSRNASPGGLAIARDFALTLSRAGLGIVSGLAAGIDASAHSAALDAGGQTIAVCATGLDRVYPRAHRELAQRIGTQGALVSEFPIGVAARADHFPRRNRIIAGLGLGTLVIEASLRSGSLITARLTGERGREVFAVPGSIHHPLARGCHRLIRDGAKLVETAADVLEELAPLLGQLRRGLDAAGADAPAVRRAGQRPVAADPAYENLLRALGHDPLNIDELVARTGLDVATISSMVLILELDRRVAALPGGRYQRVVGVHA